MTAHGRMWMEETEEKNSRYVTLAVIHMGVNFNGSKLCGKKKLPFIVNLKSVRVLIV